MLSDNLIIAITLILLGISLLFLFIRTWSLSSSISQTCPVDECATNIFNGVKRCPPKGERIELQPGIEVCNPAHSCQGITPYAIQPDGSTSSSGRCPDGEICPCVRVPFCPDYVTAYFTVFGASPFENITNTNAVVYQDTSYNNQAQNLVSFPPLSLPDDTSFCSIPPSWVSRLYPRQCIRGNLFYLTENISDFDPERDPLSCINAPACRTFTSIFETSTRRIFCR